MIKKKALKHMFFIYTVFTFAFLFSTAAANLQSTMCIKNLILKMKNLSKIKKLESRDNSTDPYAGNKPVSSQFTLVLSNLSFCRCILKIQPLCCLLNL